MSVCNSCGAGVIWAVHERTRSRMPLDFAVVTEGIRFEIRTGDLATKCQGDDPGHQSHFATCPNADQHRRS